MPNAPKTRSASTDRLGRRRFGRRTGRCLNALLLLFSPLVLLAGCDLGYPELIVVNQTDDTIQLRNISFNGCVFPGVLPYGEATSPLRCLPGKEPVRFEKFDAANYCRDQAKDATVDGVCPCDGEPDPTRADKGLVNPKPMWFNYMTRTRHRLDYGDLRVIEITRDEMEQDFSVVGPYGH